MDTVGTFETAEVLAKENLITCLHKHYTPEQVSNWGNKVGEQVLGNIAVAAGVSTADFNKAKEILNRLPAILFICLDVANGYQTSFIERVNYYRNAFPDKTIIAGNVVTPEITQILI